MFLSSNSLESGQSENPLILCVTHHRQNPIESTYKIIVPQTTKSTSVLTFYSQFEQHLICQSGTVFNFLQT
jgi:hypothetical protein